MNEAQRSELAEATGSALALRELKRLLRLFGERPGAAVCSERMEGASDARHTMRKEIRERIRLLESSLDNGLPK